MSPWWSVERGWFKKCLPLGPSGAGRQKNSRPAGCWSSLGEKALLSRAEFVAGEEIRPRKTFARPTRGARRACAACYNVTRPDIFTESYRKVRPPTPTLLFKNEDTYNPDRAGGFEKQVERMVEPGPPPDGAGFQITTTTRRRASMTCGPATSGSARS